MALGRHGGGRAALGVVVRLLVSPGLKLLGRHGASDGRMAFVEEESVGGY